MGHAQILLDEKLTYIPSEEIWEKKMLVSFAGDEEPLRSKAVMVTQLIQPQVFVWGADPPLQDLLLKRRALEPNAIIVDLYFNRSLEDLEAALVEGDEVIAENENRKIYKIRRSEVEIGTLEALMQAYAPKVNDLFDTAIPVEVEPAYLPFGESLTPFWVNLFDEVGLKNTWFGRLNDLNYPSVNHNEFGELEFLEWFHSASGTAIRFEWPVLGETLVVQGAFPNMLSLKEDNSGWYYYHVGSATHGKGGWFWDYAKEEWFQLGE